MGQLPLRHANPGRPGGAREGQHPASGGELCRTPNRTWAYTKILGPKEISPEKGIKGKVIERKVDPGQTVAASFQTPELFTIALEMDKHMHVYASVDEADIGMIRSVKEEAKTHPLHRGLLCRRDL